MNQIHRMEAAYKINQFDPSLLYQYFLYNIFPNDLSTSLIPALTTALVIIISIAAVTKLASILIHHRLNTDQQHQQQLQLPPGTFGLPLVGETLQFALFSSHPVGTPSPFLLSRFQRYGRVFKTHLMGRRTVVSMDPELNKLLLSNEERLVRVYFPGFICKIVGQFLTMHGPRHSRLREITVSHLSPTAIQQRHLIPVQDCALRLFSSWKSSGAQIVDAQAQAKKFIFTYVVEFLLGLDADDPITHSLMNSYLLLMTGYSAIPVNFPGTTYHKVLQAREDVIAILRSLIRKRRAQQRPEPLDFANAMLNEVDECGNPYSEQDVVEFLFFMVLGGFETSSMLITNLMKFLCENPLVVDELREEHTLIRKSKASCVEKLTWEDYKKMRFTDQVIKETLRMASIVHYVTRETIQDIGFKDMIIPKGWMVLISFAMVHLNPSYYTDPLKFDPWRWKDSSANSSINSTTFLAPFGGGTRSCLGSMLAKFEASMFIHYLVTHFKWERIQHKDGQVDNVSSLSFPTMQKGLHVNVQPLF